jgi:hypothetical protein
MRDYIPLLGQPGGPDAQCFAQSQQLCYAVLEGVHYPQYEASAYYSGYLLEVRACAGHPGGLAMWPSCPPVDTTWHAMRRQWVPMTS